MCVCVCVSLCVCVCGSVFECVFERETYALVQIHHCSLNVTQTHTTQADTLIPHTKTHEHNNKPNIRKMSRCWPGVQYPYVCYKYKPLKPSFSKLSLLLCFSGVSSPKVTVHHFDIMFAQTAQTQSTWWSFSKTAQAHALFTMVMGQPVGLSKGRCLYAGTDWLFKVHLSEVRD